MSKMIRKDYALVGEVNVKNDLTADAFEDEVEQKWFSAPVDRKVLKSLIKRSDETALKDFGLWLGLLLAFGIAAFMAWGTFWAIPLFFIYGVLYSAADHRHHELSHGTPFKNRKINDMFYHLCAFMTLREGNYYRWSHTRHHTHTIIVGRDPEIAAPRPPNRLAIYSDFFFISDGIKLIRMLFRHANGILTEDGKHFVPATEVKKVFFAARVYLFIFAIVLWLCLAMGSILPALFVGLPRFYGGFFSQLFNMSQHTGLAEDVADHRLNTRTVLMNPVFNFLYANMNYHIEHHMFPMVPYYRLPELHELIKAECPPPYPSIWAAWKEIIPAINRQNQDPGWFIQRPLPTV
ncbi:MAG: fatty acid desaturase [Thiolinea sp.]